MTTDRPPPPPRLLRPLPPERTLEDVYNHFLVEKELATRLKGASREERPAIYESMYDELFAKVPSHSRLTRRKDEAATQRSVESKLRVVAPFLRRGMTVAEFAPGDCRFLEAMGRHVERAFGIDISDQRDPGFRLPANVELVVYDGYHLDRPGPGSLDLIFSDQLVEHFHPEDTRLHFELAASLLKPGGVYVFRTPHAHTGPHDISKYFSATPEGFHLKEWTFSELRALLEKCGFRRMVALSSRIRKGQITRVPYPLVSFLETVFPLLGRRLRVPLSGRLVGPVQIAARI